MKGLEILEIVNICGEIQYIAYNTLIVNMTVNCYDWMYIGANFTFHVMS